MPDSSLFFQLQLIPPRLVRVFIIVTAMPGCGDTLIQGPRGTALTRNELRQHTVAYMGDKAFGKQVEAIATVSTVVSVAVVCVADDCL
jgi:hypothetical protein